jgi:hypothetical protein
MKTTLLFFSLLLCASAVFGQTASVLSNSPQMTLIPDHPEHASQHEMAPQQDILEHSGYTYAQGERPLWEFGPVSVPVPLGDVARAAKKQRETARKSEVVWQD